MFWRCSAEDEALLLATDETAVQVAAPRPPLWLAMR
jgi:hypothetical protein